MINNYQFSQIDMYVRAFKFFVMILNVSAFKDAYVHFNGKISKFSFQLYSPEPQFSYLKFHAKN